jgi:hypothetical protein
MAKPSIAKRTRTSPTDSDEKLYWEIRRCGPTMTNAQAEKFERDDQDPKRHAWRRVAFSFLCMPCEDFFGKIETDRGFAVACAESAEGIRNYVARLRKLAEVLDVAQARIETGLCKRDDYEEVFAKANLEPKASKRLSRLSTARAAHG